MGSGFALIRSRACRLVFLWVAAILLLCPIRGSGEETPTARGGHSADDWITINKDYSSQRYVDLDQITPRNVDKLREVCELRINEPVMFNTGLLKVGRTLYVTTVNQTIAFDAVTCELRWRQADRTVAGGGNSRGAGYSDGKIFRGTYDGTVTARDANTGQLLWATQGADPTKGELFVAAPIAWQGKVFIGISVGDIGIAGRLMAFDANTGKELWRFNTTLGAPSGGAFWNTFSLDPTTGEVFGSVANPFPDFNRDIVTGDKDFTKYTDSIISVDVTTGHLNWSYQVVPGDEHDFDLAAAPTLYRTSRGEHEGDDEHGKIGQHGRDMVALAGKSGRVYTIDRATQLLAFNTPATTLENDQEPLDQNWKHVCPGANGGAMFNGAAYHPGIGTLYVGMVDFCSWYIKGKSFGNPMFAGIGGNTVKDWSTAAKLQAPRGWITAIDGKSGAVRWQYQAESQVQAGLVPTKSGLLFAGDTHGNLLVFNARNGSLLTSIDTGGALNNGLISYSVGGQQYVAAAVGGATENPSTVAGPLRVSVYGLHGSGKPKVVTLDRLQLPPAPGQTAGQALFAAVCSQCHGGGSIAGQGASSPPLARQSQLSDPELLKQFLSSVAPPMPRLYPGVLQDKDVELIAEFLKTSVFNCGPNEPQSCQPPPQPMSGGTPAWQAVYFVLTSPRCINCHPVVSPNLAHFPGTVDNSGYPQDYPRQGDDRHPHYFGVLRGDMAPLDVVPNGAGMGPPFERCTFCHGSQNDPVTGIPGTVDPHGKDPTAPFWALAPVAMAWESAPGVPFTGPQLCAQLKDPTRNGNRSLSDLLDHLTNEPLVNWSFNPGTRPNGEARTTPPISHDALIEAFKKWMAEGAPCPAGKT
jgi:alcohol dehydrogenase (cytochrome c)